MQIEFGQKQINTVASNIGVLPIELLHNKREQSAFALDNGSICRFIIDGKDEKDTNYYRSAAWSSSLNHYIACDSEKEVFYLYHVQKERPEILPVSSVVNNLQLFCKYLQNSQPNNESAIDACLRIFRALRTQLHDEQDGRNSLSAFLYLLATAERRQTGYNHLVIPDDAAGIYNSLAEGHQIFLREQMFEMLNDGANRLDLDLVLRHTSGLLFEEANIYANVKCDQLLFPFENLSYQYQSQSGSSIYTPCYVARSIVEESLRCIPDLMQRETISVFDPACGSGIFIVELLRQLKKKKYQGRINATLWDMSKSAVDISRFVMSFEKIEWGEQLEYIVCQHNSLHEDWPVSDLIFMNPPYKSWDLMSIEERDDTKRILDENQTRKPNLAAVFYYLAVKSVANHGILGCLIPTSVLHFESNKSIRDMTKQYISPVLIAKLGSYVFHHAMVDASILIASKRKDVQILWTPNEQNVTASALAELRLYNQQEKTNDVSAEKVHIYRRAFCDYEKINNGSWQPISLPAFEFVQVLEMRVATGELFRLKDVFEIRQGARTGANKVFIIDSQTYNDLPECEKKYFRPSVDSESLRFGRLKKVNYLFFPSVDSFKDEKDLDRDIHYYYINNLYPNKALLMNRADIDETSWWKLTRPREWQRKQKLKLVSTEFGNSYNFAIDVTGEYVVERGHMWQLKKEDHPDTLYAYLALLRSPIMNKLLGCYAKQLAGGQWYSLSKASVGLIPFPKFTTGRHFLEFRRLVKLGRDLAKNGTCDEEQLVKVTESLYYKYGKH